MGVFYEQFLTKDYGYKQKSFVSIQQALLVLAILNGIFMGIIWALLTIGVYFLMFFIGRNKFLEFEYELTDSDLVISKIMNKKSRKIIGNIDIKNIVEVVSLNNFNRNDVKIINASLKGINKNELNEKILIVRKDLNLIGYKIAMDKKLYEICTKINPIIFNKHIENNFRR